MEEVLQSLHVFLYERMVSSGAYCCVRFLIIIIRLWLLIYFQPDHTRQEISLEQDLEFFLDHFLPSAREAFKYASMQNVYNAHITRALVEVTLEKIQLIIHSAKSTTRCLIISSSLHRRRIGCTTELRS